MSALGDGVEEAQMHRVHCTRHWLKLSRYQPAQSRKITERSNFSILPFEEEQTFLAFNNIGAWLQHMEKAKGNLLRTMLRNTELTSNSGSDGDVSPLVRCYFKGHYAGKEAALVSKIAEENADFHSSTPDKTVPSEVQTSTDSTDAEK